MGGCTLYTVHARKTDLTKVTSNQLRHATKQKTTKVRQLEDIEA